MNPVWVRLQHINARALNLVALPVFIAVALGGAIWAMWVGTGSPVPDMALTPPDSGPVTNRQPRVWAALLPESPDPNGLYGSDYLRSYHQYLEAQAAELEARENAPPDPEPEPIAAVPILTPELPPAPRETVTLVYRGYLVRPDGSRLALVENVKEGVTEIFATRAEMTGFVLGGFDRSRAKLSRGNARIILPVGEPVDVVIP